jgi:hypothetical protein
MSEHELKPVPSTSSRMDLLPELPVYRQRQPRASTAAPPSTRRKSSLSAVLRTINPIDMSNDPGIAKRRNSIAWQTLSQRLTLQVEQQRRTSELSSRSQRLKSLSEQKQEHTTISIDEANKIDEVPRVEILSPPSYADMERQESISEFENATTEEKSLLKTDVHIIPLPKLVERFDSNLQQGLTNEVVTEHRSKFGTNKLTPPPKPSLVWMFFKQILIGFNGILWLATLFAFLSYVI